MSAQNKDSGPNSASRKRHRAPRVPVRPLPLSAFALRVAVAVLVTLVILIVAAVLWLGIPVVLEAFAGVLFGVFLTALNAWVSKVTKLSHGWALAVVILALFLLAGGLGWLLASRLMAESVELADKIPQSFGQLRQLLKETGWGSYLLAHAPAAASQISPGMFVQATGLVCGIAEFFIAALVIFIVGLFGAANPEVYRAGLLHLVPPARRNRVDQVLQAIAYNLRWWLVGQAVLMILIGITTTLGLWLLGIPLALILGLIAGILEMIPYLGTWLSAILAALIAFLVSPWHVLMVLWLFLGIHVLEGYIVGPLVQRRAVRLPPAVTVLAQVLLGSLAGILGVFVAAPLTLTLIVCVKMLYVQDTLDDRCAAAAHGTDEIWAGR
jgi:predicted PurR-regulated permease PerM